MIVWFVAAPRVLIDSERAAVVLPAAVSAVMIARYGGESAAWERAYQQVRADWDSYYADLDLAGDDGLDHLWEGLFRTTRALFRLTGTPEPPKPELTALARALPYESSRRADVLYPDVKTAFEAVRSKGVRIAVYAPVSAVQINGWLEGGGVRDYVETVLGFDTVERFRHDVQYWETAARIMRADPAECRVIDRLDEALNGAKLAGMQATAFDRDQGAKLGQLVP